MANDLMLAVLKKTKALIVSPKQFSFSSKLKQAILRRINFIY